MGLAYLWLGPIKATKTAGVSPNTVTPYENGTDAYGGTLLKLRRAFEKAGLAFIDGNGEGPDLKIDLYVTFKALLVAPNESSRRSTSRGLVLLLRL